MHDGILPAAEASVHELSGFVGLGSVPRQLHGSAAVQHQRLEQVCALLLQTELRIIERSFGELI